MHFSVLTPKQAGSLLSLLLFLPIHALAAGYERRADAPLCCIGSCPNDNSGNENPTSDGPTSDQSAGIGVEFESVAVLFESKGTCSKPDVDKSKGALVDNRQGPENPPHWMLTTDTTISVTGRLTAEYILNGKQIKIGSGDAAKAASAVANDIISWNPSADVTDDVTVQGSNCNPWKIGAPAHGGSADRILWAVQVTAPLPLEGISDLISKAVADTPSELLPTFRRAKNMISVTKKFFQSQPNGISSDHVEDHVLGFFSLILSYAKSARNEETDTSPKDLTSIMARTEFTTIFAQVKDKVPLNPNSLYQLVKILGCYQNGDGGDSRLNYCTGTLAAPVPKEKMDGQIFTVNPAGGSSQSLKVQDWIQSIQDGTSPDKLTTLDRAIDWSIGGLGTVLENVIDSNPKRAVPLFEFRNLPGVPSGSMQDRVTKAENAVIDYHKQGVNHPRFVKRRTNGKFAHIKRQACPSSTLPEPTTPASATAAAPPPPPPPPTSTPGPDADSCDVSYKSVLDAFEIRGKNFDPSKFGTDGSGLKTQVKGCGALTNWKFRMTPADPTYQWYASGNLPVGTKACVGRAVVSAGGATHGNCHGPG